MSWISPTFSSDDKFALCQKNEPRTKRPKTLKGEGSSSSLQTTSCNWLEKCKPKNTSELLVNPKKVKEIEDWLQQAFKPNLTEKVLVITGASGSGKTATLHTICKSLGIKVLEWVTPVDRLSDDFTDFPSKYEFVKSAAKQFEEYVFKSSRYNSCFVSNPTKKIVLVKDLPNVFIHNPTSFHDILDRFSEFCINPVVFICADESLARKLFSYNSRSSSILHTITFNPITEQKMFKFLKSLLLQEQKTSSSVKILSDEALYTICAATQGDVRSAVSKLYFCSIASDVDVSQLKQGGKFKKPKQSNKSVETNKDSKLDFFRGIGRVLYPKKVETDKGIKFLHSTTEIIDNFLSEPKNFLSQLRENYPSKMVSMYDVSEAAERLSKSDILMSRWQEKDIFHEYGLSVAIQGIMVANRNPQKAKFEAFRKSQTSRLETDTRAVELEGKAVFSDLLISDYKRLIDILPYSKFLLPNLNQGQLDYVRKTCHFRPV